MKIVTASQRESKESPKVLSIIINNIDMVGFLHRRRLRSCIEARLLQGFKLSHKCVKLTGSAMGIFQWYDLEVLHHDR